LQTLQPAFGGNRQPKFAFGFKRLCYFVYSTSIELITRLLEGVKYRRRKGAAK
jgi:hypothetical protein